MCRTKSLSSTVPRTDIYSLFRGSPKNQEFKGSLKTPLCSQPNWFYEIELVSTQGLNSNKEVFFLFSDLNFLERISNLSVISGCT